MTSFSTIPTRVGLPAEIQISEISPTLPQETKTNSIKIYANNNPTISASISTGTTQSAQVAETPFPTTDILFDIPTSMSRNCVLDTRLSSLSFKMTVTLGTAGNLQTTSCNLRSSAYSFFDNLRVNGSSGNTLENFSEVGLVADTLLNGQLSVSDKQGLGTSYGFNSSLSTFNNTGHSIPALVGNLTSNATNSFSYCVPLLSGTIGVLANKFVPIGLLKKLQLVLTTTNILPITLTTSGTGSTTTSATVSISDFSLILETIDIGTAAMNEVLGTLHDGKAYLSGQTYRTSTSLLPSGSLGSVSLPIGLTASSVRSMFFRFYDSGSAGTTNSSNYKYDSKNPSINSYNINIGGINLPGFAYNPLLHPGMCFRSFQAALGSLNSSQFKSSITSANYCKLAAGGATTNNGTSQDSNYSLSSSATSLSSFILGENLEYCVKRGIISGRDITFQKVNLQLQTAASNTNSITVYASALCDMIMVIDVNSGECLTLM